MTVQPDDKWKDPVKAKTPWISIITHRKCLQKAEHYPLTKQDSTKLYVSEFQWTIANTIVNFL